MITKGSDGRAPAEAVTRFGNVGLPAELIERGRAPLTRLAEGDELELAVKSVLENVSDSQRRQVRISGVRTEAIVVAALRECLAMESASREFVRSHANRLRYGLIPAVAQLGMWDFKRRLEDAALKAETPGRYHDLAQQFEHFREQHAGFVVWTCEAIAAQLAAHGIEGTVEPVYCSIDGVSRRMKAFELGNSLDQAGITEFYDVTVLVPTVSECYTAIAAVHGAGKPVTRTLEDYICSPRENGFSAIVTHVSMNTPDEPGAALLAQVLIQTPDMRAVTRFGIYSPSVRDSPASSDPDAVDAPPYIRALMTTIGEHYSSDASATASEISVLAEGGKERRANMKVIAAGATVLDLAYLIHRQLGDAASYARVNGKRVELNHLLKPNDRVEIIKSKSARRTEDDLQRVVTKRARKYLRQNLNRDHVSRGRRLLARYVAEHRNVLVEDRAELDLVAGSVAEQFRERLDAVSAEALYRKVGEASDPSMSVARVGIEIATGLATRRASATLPPNSPVAEWIPAIPSGLTVTARKLRLCGRCLPGASDDLVGLVLARHITAHKRNCVYVRDRQTISLEWKRIGRTVRSVITLHCEDRPLLVHAICQRISRRGSGLEEIHATTDQYGRASVTVHVYTHSAIALGDLLLDLNWTRSVRVVELVSSTLPPEQQDRLRDGDWRRHRRELEQETGRAEPAFVEPSPGTDRRRGDIVLPYNEQKPAYLPATFLGRHREVTEMLARTDGTGEAYVLITGPRRIGKTSLALRFADAVPAAKRPHVVRIDLRQEGGSSSDVVLERIALTMRSKLGVRVSAYGDPRDMIEDIVAAVDKPVLLILDEFAAALESFVAGNLGEGLFGWIRTKMEEESPSARLRMVMVAPPEGVEMMHEHGIQKHLDRLVPLRLSILERSHAREMVMRPFASQGVNITTAAVEELITLTNGHPYYLILFMRELVALLNSRPTKWEVTGKDVTRCTNRVLQHPLCFHAAVNEARAIPAQHECLRAIAREQDQTNELVARDVIVRCTGLNGAVADTALGRLVHYGVLESAVTPAQAPSYGYVIPLIRSWVLRQRHGDLGPRPRSRVQAT